MTKKSNFIDFLKGFLILLVVLGHELQVYYTKFDQIFLFKFIYSFHMPLFMIVSGYLANISITKTSCYFEKCIKQKFIYLIIPFLFWYYFISILKGNSNHLLQYTETLVLNIDNGLWYLYVLFFCYLALYFASYFKYKYLILLLILAILPNTSYFGMKLVKYHFIFFILGYILFDYKEYLKLITAKKQIYMTIVFSCIFFISLIFWERTFTENSFFLNNFYLNIYKVNVAIIGSISIFLVLKHLYYIDLLNKLLCLFGRNSLKIYIFNFFIIGFFYKIYPNDNELFLIINAFSISYFIILINSIFLKIPYFGILIGEKYSTKND